MPLEKGCAAETISRNIRMERRANKPQDQAVAIALSLCGRERRKKPKAKK